jgi:glucose-1-phosphate adenylyltransferase
MTETLVLLLAGGVGSRLNILGSARAKPAVPFGGTYRIIDFTLSNAMNSNLDMVGILTQYKPLSLMEHVGSGAPWDFIGRTRGAKILPPRTGQKDSDWYKGTADAVRQNIDFIKTHNPKRVLILSGDHIYKMDYASLIDFHKNRKALLTVATMTVPWAETHHFGIAVTDENHRIIDWEEKPKKAGSNLASMGIYVFEANYLLDALRNVAEHDFGKHIIPAALRQLQAYAYPFEGYWRDVGTLKAYWEANMDLLESSSGLNIGDWGVRSNVEEEGVIGDRPPALLARGCKVSNAVISPGCRIHGEVENSILAPGITVERGARISNSVVMHSCHIGAGAVIDFCILDKDVVVGSKAELGTKADNVPNIEQPAHLDCGLIVVGKAAQIPDRFQIGKNAILHPKIRREDYPGKQVSAGATVRPKTGEA